MGVLHPGEVEGGGLCSYESCCGREVVKTVQEFYYAVARW